MRLPPSSAPTADPFLKWAGSKRELVAKSAHLLPPVEPGRRIGLPFMGGGAVAFHYASLGVKALMSDADPHLVNAFLVVRDQVETLIMHLLALTERGDTEGHYAEIRSNLNTTGAGTAAERAAWFIAINKWGFNGLWRVNGSGGCNVPFGKPSSPGSRALFDPQNLRAAAHALQGSSIHRLDFEWHVEQMALEEGDAVYFDPPYVPVNATSSFTGYTAGGFTHADQERLVALLHRLDARGIRWAVSNSDTPVTRKLYAHRGWRTKRGLTRKGTISSKANGREAVGEILVRNW